MKQRFAENPNIDKLAADMVHDSRHGEQFKRGLSYSPETAFPMEMEASSFTVDVLKAIGTFSSSVVQGYEDDARNGHGSRSISVDKSTPRSRAKVFERMKKPR